MNALGILATRFYTYGYVVPTLLRDLHRSTPIPPRNQVTFWVGTGFHSQVHTLLVCKTDKLNKIQETTKHWSRSWISDLAPVLGAVGFWEEHLGSRKRQHRGRLAREATVRLYLHTAVKDKDLQVGSTR